MQTHPDLQWLQDFEVGQSFAFGYWRMTTADILEFARKYDPEPFHLDPERARALGWGDIIASGPQVAAICRRMQKDGFPNVQTVISPGWEHVKWRLPVYAGDQLTAHGTVYQVRPLASRPGEGLMQMDNRILRQDGAEVASMLSNWFVRMRPPSNQAAN